MTNAEEPKEVPLSEKSLPELEAALQHAGEAKGYWSGQEKQLNAELERRFKGVLVAEIKKKDDPFGSADIEFQGYQVKGDLPKKVDWNQDLLRDLQKEIITEWGEDPGQYITVDLSISEKTYKAWPASLQEKFIGARTVKEGTFKISIEKKAA